MGQSLALLISMGASAPATYNNVALPLLLCLTASFDTSKGLYLLKKNGLFFLYCYPQSIQSKGVALYCVCSLRPCSVPYFQIPNFFSGTCMET